MGRAIDILAQHYSIEAEIGRGWTATVHRARDPVTGALIALKILHSDLARTVGAQRFLREIEILGRLTHPRIVPLLSWGHVEPFPGLTTPWLAMPYIGPRNLRGWLRESGEIPLDDSLAIGRDLCEALQHAHDAGVLHRDLTPSNVLISDGGGALLTDFGVARAVLVAGGDRLSSTGVVVGSPAYMSPEQARGEQDLTQSSDLYSLGLLLYEMIAGEPVFPGPNPQDIAYQQQQTRPISIRILRPEVPKLTDELVSALLAKEPKDRPESAAEVAKALR